MKVTYRTPGLHWTLCITYPCLNCRTLSLIGPLSPCFLLLTYKQRYICIYVGVCARVYVGIVSIYSLRNFKQLAPVFNWLSLQNWQLKTVFRHCYLASLKHARLHVTSVALTLRVCTSAILLVTITICQNVRA